MSNTESIKYPFSLHSNRWRVAHETDYAEHVEQLIKQVLFTSPGERLNRPDFGCGLRTMIFAPLADITESLTKITVAEALERWLGDLLSVIEVKVTISNEILELGIIYNLTVKQQRRYLNLEVVL